MSIDDYADGDLEQRWPCGVAAGGDAHAPMELSTEADKENFIVDAAPSQVGDANPEVTNAQENHACSRCASFVAMGQ